MQSEQDSIQTALPAVPQDDVPRALDGQVDSSYARRIGAALLAQAGTPGLVVSLESSWGYGRQLVLGQVADYLRSEDVQESPVVVEFNPRYMDPGLNLAPALFTQLASVVGQLGPAETREKTVKKLAAYGEAFLQDRALTDKEQWQSLEVLTASCGFDSGLQHHDVTRQHVSEALLEMNRPLVVLIDELELLNAGDVLQLFKLVLLLASFPRVSVLLAFDPGYVEGLLAIHGIMTPDAYLERLLQMRVPFGPARHSDMTVLFEAEMKKFPVDMLHSSFADAQERYTEVYEGAIRGLIGTPAEIKRIFDRLRFSARATRSEVAFPDILALETLAVKTPAIYDHIKKNPEAYTGVPLGEEFDPKASCGLVERHASTRLALLEQVGEPDKKSVERIFELLFPLTVPECHPEEQRHYRNLGRVAASECLSIALTYGLPEKTVLSPFVKAFMDACDSRRGIVKEVLKLGEIERFLTELRAVVDEYEIANQDDFVSVLAILANSRQLVVEEEKRRGPPNATLVKQVWWVLERFFAKLRHNERIRYLSVLMANVASLNIATEALTFCLRQRSLLGEDETATVAACWSTKRELAYLKAGWVKTATAVFNGSYFCAMHGKREILQLLQRVNNDEARRIVNSLMQLEEDLDCLAFAFRRKGKDPCKGWYVLVEEEFLDAIGGIETIRNRVRHRIQSGPPIHGELAAIYESVETGQEAYLEYS